VAAIFRMGNLIIPRGDNKIMPHDKIYFVSRPKNLFSGMKLLGHKREKIDDIIIHGGGYIGRNLALALEKRGVNVKMFEPDSAMCSIANQNLNKTVILNATGTDQDSLEEENIDKMGAFVSVTKDDEDNILSALLAKRLGCPLTLALTHKTAYQPLIASIGVDIVINPRQLTNNTILHFIRKGKVIHASALRENAEIIDVEALETSDLVGKPLKKLKLPKETLILSIKRGDNAILPDGDTVINSGDRVLMIANRKAIPKIEKFITVKLEYF